MKFAIISDTHNNMANFNKIIDWLNKENIGLLLHCGDIASYDTINQARKNFKGEIIFARGNADYGMDDIPQKQEKEIDGKKVAFVHFPDEAKNLCQSGKYDFVFYGHTHRAWQETLAGCQLVNPGEAAGQYYKATFAVCDAASGRLELKLVERL